MTKNAPLQSPRTICRVLGIGFFLFCAALFAAAPARADYSSSYASFNDAFPDFVASTSAVDLISPPGVWLYDNFTIDVWIKTSVIKPHWYNAPIILGQTNQGGGVWASWSMIMTDGKIGVVFNNTWSGQWVGVETNNAFNDGNWHEINFLNSGCGYNTCMTFLVDGIVQSISAIPGSVSSLSSQCAADSCSDYGFGLASHSFTINPILLYLEADDFNGEIGNFFITRNAVLNYWDWAFATGWMGSRSQIKLRNINSGYLSGYVSGLTIIGPSKTSGNLSSAGVSINPNWFCCADSCGYPISMPAQLGWWGIGATSTRAINWGIDNTPITNTIDFSNKTNSLIQISSSTSFGFHVLHLEIYINNQLLATGSVNIQIVAGSECANTNSDQFNAFCEFPCAGLATSTNPLDLQNFQCGLQKFGCWLVKPMPSSISYVIGQFNGLTTRFPLAPFTKLYDDLNLAASDTQIISPGNIEIPFWSTTSRTYVGKNFDLGSSTLSHSYAWTKIRRLEVIGMWCIGILPIILILIKLIL